MVLSFGVTNTLAALLTGPLQVTADTTSNSALDSVLDSLGNLHTIYVRDGSIRYRKVLDGNSTEETIAAGSAPSIVLDSTNTPHISFISSGVANYTNRTGGTWSTPLPIVGSGAIKTSIDIDGSNKVHIISFSGGYGTLDYATNTSGSFVITNLFTGAYDSGSGNYIYDASLKVDPGGHYHIIATTMNWGGRCSWSSKDINFWTNNPSVGNTSMYIGDCNASAQLTPKSIVLDGSGNIHLANVRGGTVYYGYVPATSPSSWTESSLGSGTEPALASKGTRVGIAFKNNGIYYSENSNNFASSILVDADAAATTPVPSLGSLYVTYLKPVNTITQVFYGTDQPAKYYVIYNGNGNTTGTAPTDAGTYLAGASVTVLGNTGALAKTGYTFSGWNTKADGSGSSYSAAETFAIAGNTTLYAKWTASLTYNGNGNTGGTAPTDTAIYLPGAIATILDNTGALTKTGYTFADWNTASDGSGTSWPATSAFTIAGDTTLYAKWTISSYTVSFASNGGSVVTSQSINYNSSVTIPAAPTKTGYTFAGWYSDIALTTPFAFATAITADTTLYAKWTINSYTVSFTSNGGSVVTSQSVNYNSPATLPAAPTKTGYTFAGWYSDTALITPFAFATAITADTTLYAKWTINSYTVSFASNGGSVVTSQSVNYNLPATLPAAPTKTGYTFAGWYSDVALTTPFAFSTAITADTTLYAKWTINSYTVSFTSNGGSVVTSQNVNYNSPATLPAAPAKTGYTLAGWYSDIALTTPFAFSTAITADTTLYAKWTINSYTVSFASNGGSVVTSQSVNYNSTATLPAAPTKTGYTFAGWYSDVALTTPFVFATAITADTTLYAKWTINSYTVTPSAGTGSGMIPDAAQTANSGTTVSFTIAPIAGYGILSVTGCNGTLSGNIYTTGEITGNCTVVSTAVKHNGNSGTTSNPTIVDALKALQGHSGTVLLTPEEMIRYDVAPLATNGVPQGNGVVDIADVIMILRRSIGIGEW